MRKEVIHHNEDSPQARTRADITFEDDHGHVISGAEAAAAWCGVANACATSNTSVSRRRSTIRGRAPRMRSNARRRGSRRASRTTHATSSSSDSDPPGPPQRPCACGCGRVRRTGSYYASDDCRRRHARDRKRLQRLRVRENPDRVVEREAAIAWPAATCGCIGSKPAYPGDHAWTCIKCGRPIEGMTSSVNGHVASADVLWVLREEMRAGGAGGGRSARTWRGRSGDLA